MKKGSKTTLNKIKGYGGALLAKNEEIRNIAAQIGAGALLFNTDTRELKVAAGNETTRDLLDHRHPYTHAPLVHTHIAGMNESWCVGNPRLWYTDDLVNHPELCPLDGEEIPLDAADKLAEVYPGTKLLTTPLKVLGADGGFTNGEITLKASTYKGDYLPAHLCGEVVDISNFARISDQWLIPGDYTQAGQSITIHIDGDYSYRPDSYWLMPAAGTATEVLKHRPTPNSWKLEGSNDGSSWEVIDTRSDITDMQPCTIYPYQCATLNDYFYFRLTITKWNEGDDATLEPGLRRFWIFGRRPNTFCLPDIPSPHPDFTWVTPYKELNVSMKNEDIGDIGITGISEQILPPYRMETNGRMLSRETYEELFNAIGWRYDDIEMSGNQEETSTDVFIINLLEPSMLGKYTFTAWEEPDPYDSQPLNWKIEGQNKDGSWEVITEIYNNEDYKALYCLDTTTQEKGYNAFRFTITEWGGSGATAPRISVGVHPVGFFYIPDITSPEGTSYIVTQHTAHDVSADIIQRLQADILKLAQAQTSLQQQLQALLPDLEKE